MTDEDRAAYRRACEAAEKVAAIRGEVIVNWKWQDGELTTMSRPRRETCAAAQTDSECLSRRGIAAAADLVQGALL